MSRRNRQMKYPYQINPRLDQEAFDALKRITARVAAATGVKPDRAQNEAIRQAVLHVDSCPLFLDSGSSDRTVQQAPSHD